MSRHRIWQFLRDPKNLALFAAAGGALAFLWKDVVSPILNKAESPAVPVVSTTQKQPAPLPERSQRAVASDGGIAVNAVDQANVTVRSGDPQRK